MTTSRADHLGWCKERAVAELERGDRLAAIGSMISDLQKWDGGTMYDPELIRTLWADGVFFRKTDADVRNWIEGFG